MKVLVIGPSDTGSRGGMATVIAGIRDSKYLNKKFEIEIHPSYIDGNLMTRFSYSVFAFVKFLLTYKRYDCSIFIRLLLAARSAKDIT